MKPLHVFSWYVLETNYDPWNAPPASDDRRDAGIAAMNKVGREKMDPRALYEVRYICSVNENFLQKKVMKSLNSPSS